MDAVSRPLPSGPSRATNPGAQTWSPWDESIRKSSPCHPSELGKVLPRQGAYGVQGRSTLGLSRICYGMLSIENNGGERRYLGDLRKEQMWAGR